MSSSDRRKALLGLASFAGLAACGFEPAYAPAGGQAGDLQGRILVDAPNSALEFALVERLEQRLGRASDAKYRLSYNVSTASERLALTTDEETTRYSVRGWINFQLRDTATGNVVQSGGLNNFTAYSATASTIATLTAERDAERRLMVILADQLVTRLTATADTWLR
jgi:LPS-assembly lipoprotein